MTFQEFPENRLFLHDGGIFIKRVGIYGLQAYNAIKISGGLWEFDEDDEVGDLR